jgi:nucleoside-diphosphate-sugar epimerase
MIADWKGKTVLVTGGAAFIGSHLVDALVDRGARVRVVDDLSSGRIENLRRYWEHSGIEFRNSDLLEPPDPDGHSGDGPFRAGEGWRG